MHNVSVLIVDDVLDNIELLGKLLDDKGYSIEFATNGIQALEWLDSKIFDLILLDIMMPGMDGFEVCKKIKTQSSTKEIPVIFMTALSDSGSKIKAFETGAVDYITKPFEEKEVLARIENQIKLSKLQKQLSEANKLLEQKVEERTIELVERNNQILKINDALRISEEKYRGLFESNKDGITIFLAYPDGSVSNFVEMNNAAVEMLGYTKDEFINFSVLDLESEPTNTALKIRQQEIITKGYATFETELKHKNGTLISVEIKAIPVQYENKLAIMNIVKDVTERKKYETELKLAKDKAEESNRLKTAFFNNISHEIRTPLNAIVGFSQFLTKPNNSEEKIAVFTKMISKGSEQLISIITDIIEVSQVQTNQIKLNCEYISCKSIIKDLHEQYRNLAGEKGLAFEFTGDCKCAECLIFTDFEKLRRIISHLTENAIKFTNEGTVKLHVEIKNNCFQIIVSDTGIGISDEMQKIIFEPFRQVETGITRSYGGNGLGLSLVKAYVELFKGDITLKSEINKGSTFFVTIPVSNDFQIKQIPKTENQKLKVKTLLIAEDELSNFEYLKELLSESGFKILHAVNGLQAIDFCRNNAVDLVLMDIKMPVVDGQTATRIIKSFRPDLPVIAQTSYALDSEREIFLPDFDDYISKPISELKLKNTLAKFIA